MTYLLDTCVISDFVKGDRNTISRLQKTPPSGIFISAITLMEIQYGLALNPARASKIQPAIQGILDSIHILEFASIEAAQAAQIRQSLKTKGTPIGAYDVLIAATALTKGLITVTANVREFERVADLTIENWRIAPV